MKVTWLRLTAIVSGAFMLCGKNWARWLAVVWIAYHVILSGFHSLNELAMHAVLLAASTYVLLRPRGDEILSRREIGAGVGVGVGNNSMIQPFVPNHGQA